MNEKNRRSFNTTTLMQLWRRHGWLIIGILWAVALALAYTGFALNPAVAGKSRTPLDLAYRTLQLIPMNSGDVRGSVSWQLQVARFLIPFLAAWTAARALVALFHDRWQQLLVRFWRDHVVICGLSRKGWLLARDFAGQGYRVVVIESDGENDLVGPSRECGATVLIGNATAADMLQRAGATRARHVIAVTDDDGVNVEIAVQVQALLSARSDQPRTRPVTCTVHLVDPQLVELARARELAVKERASVRFELFNVYDRGARLLWNRYGVNGSPLEDALARSEGCKAHLLVVGLGRLGESLVVTAARDWHARLHETPCAAAGLLRITAIDLEADWKCETLSQRYPQLAETCDLAPVAIDVRGPAFFEGAFLAAGSDLPGVGIVYICFDDDSLGLRTGLAIHQRLRQLHNSPVPVIVRMAEEAGLARLLGPAEEDQSVFAGLQAFGLIDGTCTSKVILGGTHEALARGLHEGYVRRQTRLGQTPATNASMADWDDLSEEIRDSNRGEADAIRPHLRSLGYDLAPLTDWDAALFRLSDADVERLAEMEHTRWVAERKAAGWQYTPGPKTVQAKLSSALLSWPDLPEEERAKCRTTAVELPANLARAGFQIVRLALNGVRVGDFIAR